MRATHWSNLAIVGFSLVLSGQARAAVEFTTDPSDGTYKVDILRRYNLAGQTTTFADVNSVNVGTQSTNIIEGDGWVYQWNGSSANDPSATSTLRFTLDNVYSVKKFVHNYFSHQAKQYEISTSVTGFSSMTNVIPLKTASANNTDTLATPVLAKYIEYKWKQTNTSPYVLVNEFSAFAEKATNPRPITSDSGFNLTSMSGVTTTNVTFAGTGADAGNGWVDSVNAATDFETSPSTYLRGQRNNGYTGNGDARLLVNLGQAYKLGGVSLGFYHGQFWGLGTTVELSLDGVNFTTVYDTNSAISSGIDIMFGSLQSAQYVRLTDKKSDGGALTGFEIIGLPEPTSMAILGLAGLALARRRRTT